MQAAGRAGDAGVRAGGWLRWERRLMMIADGGRGRERWKRMVRERRIDDNQS